MDPVKLENDMIELMIQLKEIIPKCLELLEIEIVERKYDFIKIIRKG